MSSSATQGLGGSGGGGNGNSTTGGAGAQNGTANTGSGGGGNTGPNLVGTGGSGFVCIRYADTFALATSTTGSPTITTSGGYRIYQWTGSGSITF
jgi:hypothetical protein